jgi:hypothetical protein
LPIRLKLPRDRTQLSVRELVAQHSP